MVDLADIRSIPYDPMCRRFAADMSYLDSYWAESQEELDNTPHQEYPERRSEFIRREEGTYNPTNGHFLCDACYIEAGMPSGPNGWMCP